MFDILITGGKVIDGGGGPWFRADVGVRGDRITALGRLGQAQARIRIDAAGKVVTPGFIDAHVHGDLMLLANPLHEPAIRQGVTTYLIGQDGESMAPASAATLEHMRRYTAGFNGNPPEVRLNLSPQPPSPIRRGGRGGEVPIRRGGEVGFLSVADYLHCFDRRCALNVAYLIPNGSVRMEALGLATRAATPEELRHMRRLVREGMEQGAVGLSSGLDYIPSRYADTEELIALCEEIAPFGGVYVTHMRRYDPAGLDGSMDEVFRIGQEADVAVHVSHFNVQAALGLAKLDAGRAGGVDATFDLYCYLAGSTILGMIALPPWVQEGGTEATLERLRDPSIRRKLEDWFATPDRGPLDQVRLSYVEAEAYRHLEGQTLADAARENHPTLGELVCDVLVASNMVVGCVAPHRQRGEEDVRALMRHPGMMAGSDGIFVGGRPHPRGCGCFARYLGPYVRDFHTWPLEEAVTKLSGHAARRFQLKDRGLLREGFAADVVVFDPDVIQDRSTYDDGKKLATGVEHVLVNGELVLHAGRRTPALPGRALRRG
jgi:N-acyl-D-amino-acid deacylase